MRLRALIGRQRRVKELLLRPGNREIHGSVAHLTTLQGGGHCLEKASASVRSERWSCFLRQAVKVDSAMKRVIHHEDAETVFG
jgi:hypothetical protein